MEDEEAPGGSAKISRFAGYKVLVAGQAVRYQADGRTRQGRGYSGNRVVLPE